MRGQLLWEEWTRCMLLRTDTSQWDTGDTCKLHHTEWVAGVLIVQWQHPASRPPCFGPAGSEDTGLWTNLRTQGCGRIPGHRVVDTGWTQILVMNQQTDINNQDTHLIAANVIHQNRGLWISHVWKLRVWLSRARHTREWCDTQMSPRQVTQMSSLWKV